MKVLYPAKETVSVWIGTFRSEEEFDRCVDGPITDALGLPTPLARICEVYFQSELMEISDLIQGFSGWKSFIEEAATIAKAKGMMKANAALVCYFVKCDDAAEVWDGMQFLGSLKGGRVAR